MEDRVRIDQPAPDFTLNDLIGRPHTLSDLRGQIVVLNFWSAECPWAQRADEALLPLIEDWGNRVVLLPIATNANEAPALLEEVAAERGLPLVLHDRYQHVADLYGAQATPHIFVLDEKGILRYQGAFDDVTFRRRTPTRQYVQEAVQALLARERPDPAQTPPYGCAIVRYD